MQNVIFILSVSSCPLREVTLLSVFPDFMKWVMGSVQSSLRWAQTHLSPDQFLNSLAFKLLLTEEEVKTKQVFQRRRHAEGLNPAAGSGRGGGQRCYICRQVPTQHPPTHAYPSPPPWKPGCCEDVSGCHGNGHGSSSPCRESMGLTEIREPHRRYSGSISSPNSVSHPPAPPDTLICILKGIN